MPAEFDDQAADVAETISRHLRALGRTAATAESLTSGSVATRLGAAESSSEWFAGGVVAYAEEVKFRVLDVTPGPVVTAECALQMAVGVARLMDADYAVSLTGVGGPDVTEGNPPGTVFFAVTGHGRERVEEQHFAGEVDQVVRASILHALTMLESLIGEDLPTEHTH